MCALTTMSPKDVDGAGDVISLTSSDSESKDAPPPTQRRPSFSIARAQAPPRHLEPSALTSPAIMNVSDMEDIANRFGSDVSVYIVHEL